MAETHQPHAIFLVLDPLDKLLNAFARTLDLAEHRQHRFVRPTVQWAVQRVDPGRNRREDVRLRRPDQAHGRGGCVLFVVFVKNEQPVERTAQYRVDLVWLGHRAEVELQKVVDETQAVVWVEKGLAEALLVGVRRNHGKLGKEADDRDLNLLRIVHVERVLIVRRQSRHGARQHGHRMRVVRQGVEESTQVLVQESVTTNLLVELRELSRARQVAVDEKPGDFKVGRVLSDVLNGVAAITQDALVTVDERDRTLCRRRVHETQVQGGESGLFHEGGNIDAVAAVDATDDRKFGRTARVMECRLLGGSGAIAHRYSL